MTLSITMLCTYAVYHYAERRILFIIMMNVIMLSVVMPNVVILSAIVLRVVMLSVMAPS
jgi:hypothetical protein